MEAVEIYLITGLVFLLAGTVKGVVGFGLPLVSITLLTPFYGLVDAIAIMASVCVRCDVNRVGRERSCSD